MTAASDRLEAFSTDTCGIESRHLDHLIARLGPVGYDCRSNLLRQSEPSCRRCTTALSDDAQRHLWMHFTRLGAFAGNEVPIIARGEGCYVFDTTASATSTASRACSPCRSATVARSSPRPPASRPRSSPTSPSGRSRTSRRSRWPSVWPSYAPGDLNRVFFTPTGGDAVETAIKLARQYWKLRGQHGRTKVISRYLAYHGTIDGRAQPHRRALHQDAVRAADAGRHQGANPVSLPLQRLHAPRRVHAALRRRPCAAHRDGRPRQHRRGVHGAGAEHRRRVHPTRGLLAARPRDLRRVRHPAGQRRSDLRLRSLRAHVRQPALRLPARHDHVRQGRHLRLLRRWVA